MARKTANYQMSRNDFLTAHTPNRRGNTKEERLELGKRLAKKYLRDHGLIGPKIPSQWRVDIGDLEPIVVTAHTRSEAKARIKTAIGLKSLPPGLKIERLPNESSSN